MDWGRPLKLPAGAQGFRAGCSYCNLREDRVNNANEGTPQSSENGKAVAGEVRDDTAIFLEAKKHLHVWEFDVLFPQQQFNDLQNTLASERRSSQYRYGFPNGEGDCNCTTWVERIGVPVLSGRMDELDALLTFSVHHLNYQQRQFGACTP